MKTNIVQTLWIDDVLGQHQYHCLNSFLKKGSEVYLYTYGSVENVPDGVVLRDANEILSQRYIFKDLYDSYATFSDWFRIKMLYENGGWWVDADMFCIKPFDIDWPYVFATETECTLDSRVTHICNCVIKMPKGNIVGKSILDRISKTLSETDPKQIKWTAIGAKFLTAEIIKREMFDYVVDPKVFCPFDYASYREIFTETSFPLSDITYGIHLWNKMWEWSNKEPLKEMAKNSLFSYYTKS